MVWWMTALFVSHYLNVVGALQVAGGVLLFTGRWVPLGLTLLRGASRFHGHRNPNRIRNAVVNRRSISPASIFCRFLVAISDRSASCS
jgi:hypothetical protein